MKSESVDLFFLDMIESINSVNDLINDAINSKDDHELKSILIGVGHQIGFLTASIQHYAVMAGKDTEEKPKPIGFK